MAQLIARFLRSETANGGVEHVDILENTLNE